MGAEAGPPRAGRPRRPGGPPPPAPPLLSGRRPRGRTPRWTSRASRLPLELPPLRREFPGLLLNCNFECSSGRCLRFLPVPHFPRPRPANEGAPQQQSRAAARPPAPGPAPRLRAAPAPRAPPAAAPRRCPLRPDSAPRAGLPRFSPGRLRGGVGGCLPRGLCLLRRGRGLPPPGRRGLAAAWKLAGEGAMRGEPPTAPLSRPAPRPVSESAGQKTAAKMPQMGFQNDAVISICRFYVASIICVRRHVF